MVLPLEFLKTASYVLIDPQMCSEQSVILPVSFNQYHLTFWVPAHSSSEAILW